MQRGSVEISLCDNILLLQVQMLRRLNLVLLLAELSMSWKVKLDFVVSRVIPVMEEHLDVTHEADLIGGVNQIEQQDVQNMDNGFDPNFLEDIFLLDVAHGNPYVVESPFIERQSVVQGPVIEAELIAKNEEEAPALAHEYEEEAPAPAHEEKVPEYIVAAFPNTKFRFITKKWLTDSDIRKNCLLLPSGDFHKLETTFGQDSLIELTIYEVAGRSFPVSMKNQRYCGSGSGDVNTQSSHQWVA